MPRPAPSQAWRAGAAEEVLPVQGDARATAGRTIGRAVPREEDVTFASGSRGMRMEKGRGAAAAGQPRLFAFGGHLPRYICTWVLGTHAHASARLRLVMVQGSFLTLVITSLAVHLAPLDTTQHNRELQTESALVLQRYMYRLHTVAWP